MFVIEGFCYRYYRKNKKNELNMNRFIPLFAGSKTPPQNLANAGDLGGSRAARKSPIGEG
ncbi:hypothetical protein [Bacillus cereus group sp. RP43]|uniref:hypothetical protein n=1 Tax=Bacillus cereus group sp. RP43 TaxID=3040260 RepID=UPI0011A57413